jgi:hypothetical protein
VFLGLNPGGSGAAAWAYQDEVKTLFLRLVAAARIPKSWQRFMDEDVLTSNFCPFRSKNWRDLPRKQEAVEFSSRLWREVLAFVRPRLIVCNGSSADGGDGARDGGAAFQVTVVEVWGRGSVLPVSGCDALGLPRQVELGGGVWSGWKKVYS